MERRDALKTMGMAMGLTVATPTLLGILQSCKRKAASTTTSTWTPKFFTPEEGAVLIKLVDILIPKTDTPSASEMQVHTYIDTYVSDVSDEPEQEMYRMPPAFIAKALADSGKSKATDLSAEDLEPVLAASLAKRDAEEDSRIRGEIATHEQAMATREQESLDEAIALHAFATNLRSAVVTVYKLSKYVGEEVLAYESVPGPEYIPCGDVDELTGGKAWSIS